MRNVKKARPAGGAAGQAMGSCDRAGQQSQTEYNTQAGKSITIFDLLPIGAENAVSRRQLIQITGLEDRKLRRKIEKERRAGALILSSSADMGGGYFRPANAEELRRWITMMEAHANSIATMLHAVKTGVAMEEEIGR